MKSTKKIFVVALAALMLVAFAACSQPGAGVYKDVKRIEVTQTGDFVKGQAFDPSKFTVTAYYSDGSAPETIKTKLDTNNTWEADSATVTATLVTSSIYGAQEITLKDEVDVVFQDFTGINFSDNKVVLEPTVSGDTYDYSTTLTTAFTNLAAGLKSGENKVTLIYGEDKEMPLSNADFASFMTYIKNLSGSEWGFVDEQAKKDLLAGKLVEGEQEVVIEEIETNDTPTGYFYNIATNLVVTVEPDVPAKFDHYAFKITNDPWYGKTPAWQIYAVDTDGNAMAENYTALGNEFTIINNATIPTVYGDEVTVIAMRADGKAHEGETVEMTFPAGQEYINAIPAISVRTGVTVDPGVADKADFQATATWVINAESTGNTEARPLADNQWELVPGQVIKNSGETKLYFRVTWDNMGTTQTDLVTFSVNK